MSEPGISSDAAFAEYMQYGGFPYLSTMKKTPEKASVYLEGIYNTVIVKDIEDRQRRRENDSNKRKISANTVNDYMESLSESFIFYKADRFDIVGKQLLKTNSKWYIVDLGLRGYILPRQRYDLGFSIENIVYFELLRRGYQVNIGKSGNTEVDFVARKQSVYTYIQVTADMTSEETFAREMRPLESIRDNYEKIVLTLDRFSTGNYNGINVMNVIDWLLPRP